MIFLIEAVKFELDQLAQASQISPGQVLQATNTSSSIKEPFLSPSFPLNPPLTPSTSSSITTDHHEPPLLAVRPPHGEEQFNQSGIFKTQLEDSVENRASNPSFVVSSR